MNKTLKTKDYILRIILDNRTKLSFFGVKKIGLFGSFVRGEQTFTSDVDILIDFFPEKHTFDNFMDVSFFLEDLLGCKVDLVTSKSLSPHIGPYILKEVEFVTLAA